jgi:hypothetical protein
LASELQKLSQRILQTKREILTRQAALEAKEAEVKTQEEKIEVNAVLHISIETPFRAICIRYLRFATS